MNKNTIGIAVLALTLGLGGGYWFSSQNKSVTLESQGGKVTTERKPLFYRNPMNPSVTSPVPAKDNMGMDYIPVFADNAASSNEPAGTVTIDPVTVQNIGVRTALAERKTLTREVQSVGRVDYDEKLITRLHPKTEGWIGKLRVDETGEPVKKDQILLSIYSPQLVSTQEEYLLALNNMQTLKNSPFPDIRRGAKNLLRSTRERLELLDVPEHQIRKLERTRKVMKFLHIHSPFDGIVVNIGARDGQFVTPQTELYMIADLSNVWTYVDVYEYELPWIKLGDEVDMRLASLPGEKFSGKITYIYPYLNAKTRTIKIRLEFKNPDMKLKPNMFADVTIHASKQINAIVIPSEAVLRTGTRNAVFVVRGPGKYEPRDVKLGISSDGLVQILEGVKAGEEVVTSAQFLIDSESKLREAAAKMMEAKKPTPADPRPAMDMEGMDMKGMDGMDMGGMDMKGMNMKKGGEK
ncbi:MAG: efflux RND transporter periplasmic adaptor subunit [Mariprofundaceae bacterium]|nr:efflux RND transporter periplasmic adaptor subunit [Mariprofundaceae bacterium]